MKATDETKVNLDTGGIDTTDDSKRSVSLGQQAFDVLNGFLIGELVKKNGFNATIKSFPLSAKCISALNMQLCAVLYR